MISDEKLREKLRKACDKAGSIRKWARAHGQSQGYISDILAGKIKPTPGIGSVLGYSKRNAWVKVKRATK